MLEVASTDIREQLRPISRKVDIALQSVAEHQQGNDQLHDLLFSRVSINRDIAHFNDKATETALKNVIL